MANHRIAWVISLLRWAGQWPGELQYCRNYREWTPELAGKQQTYTRILAEIEKLPFHQRRLVREFYIRNRTWVSIAAQTGKSEAWCRVQRDKAAETLAVLLWDLCPAQEKCKTNEQEENI